MSFFGEKDFDEIRGDEQFLRLGFQILPRLKPAEKRRVGRLAAGDEIPIQYPFGNLGNREVGQRAANIPPRVAQLQAAAENRIKTGAGNNAHLARFGNGTRQRPGGDGGPHPALNDDRFRPGIPSIHAYSRLLLLLWYSAVVRDGVQSVWKKRPKDYCNRFATCSHGQSGNNCVTKALSLPPL